MADLPYENFVESAIQLASLLNTMAFADSTLLMEGIAVLEYTLAVQAYPPAISFSLQNLLTSLKATRERIEYQVPCLPVSGIIHTNSINAKQ